MKGAEAANSAARRKNRSRRPYRIRRVSIRRYAGNGDPPRLQWKACHPSAVKRFKAEMTCTNGHGLVLKGHSVDASGNVNPSVVCHDRNCSFHDFVQLAGWSFGDVER